MQNTPDPKVLTPKKPSVIDEVAPWIEKLLVMLIEKDKAAREKDFEMKKRVLEILEAQLARPSGEQFDGMMSTIIKEFSRGLEKVIDLKKFEAATGEDWKTPKE